MQRRKFIIGMGSLAAGSAAAMGTGAVDSVSADRNVTVETVGDASAYLQITGDSDYVVDDSNNGALTINLGAPDNSGDGAKGSGFNNNAITVVSDVITITNHSPDKNDLDVSVNSHPSAGAKFSLDGDFNNENSDSASVSSGESVTLNVRVDTKNYDPNNIGGILTIGATN